LKVEAIFKTSQFPENAPGPRFNFQKMHPCPGWSRAQVRTRDITDFSQNGCHPSYSGPTLTSENMDCLCVNMYLIFNPWWILSPCNMLMCTNKTCFAGVGTRPKTIFWIRISFLSYPCESKKKSEFSVSRSDFDSRCKPGVSSSWMEFDFCFAIENSRLCKTVICSTNSSSHCLSKMRNIHVSHWFSNKQHCLSLSLSRLTAFRWRCD